jgi:NADH-quinone oxidoreductase subunit J
VHELLIQVVFYVFAAIAVVSAVMVITQNNPVRCVLFLVVTFFASAALWILMEAEFLALILILVYVGAVMTLFLFVVMMLNIDIESSETHLLRYLPFGLIIVALLTGLLMTAVPQGTFKGSVETSLHSEVLSNTQEVPKAISNTEALGRVLYTDYVLAFELAAVILLVAIISAITLVHRGTIRSKRQNVLKQMMTRSEDRLTLINMKVERQHDTR